MPPAPVGSKTIPLAQAPGPRPVTPAAPGSPAGRQTTRLVGGSPATQPLPKATMKLTKTEQIQGPATAAISSAPIKTAQFEEEEEEDNEGLFNGLGIVSLVGSIAALFVALLGFQKIKPFNQPPVLKTDTSAVKSWVDGGTNDWKIPAEYNPFSKKLADDNWKNEYSEIKKNNYELPSPTKPITS
jgi:hypothetical protein